MSSTIDYIVVLNEEEQYSIWPSFKEMPGGWREGGCKGTKEECLAFIESVWTDMRPLSLRKEIESRQQLIDEQVELAKQTSPLPLSRSSLVDFLCRHEQAFKLYKNESESFAKMCERGVIHLVIKKDGYDITLIAGLRTRSSDICDKDTVALRGELVVDFIPLKYEGELDMVAREGICRFSLNKESL